MFENLCEKIHRWWYGCDHEWETYGAEFFEDKGPKLDISGEREIYERRYMKQTRCEKCGMRGGRKITKIEEKMPKK